MSAVTSLRCSSFTASTLSVTRTAPTVRRPEGTGSAVKRMSAFSESL